MKLGVIGAGYWGKNHVREYSALGHEVVACDLLEENLEHCRKQFGIKNTTKEISDVLSDREVKAVSICLPNQFHYDAAVKALNAGKNVLLEKPMTLNHKEALELVKLAEKKKLLLTVGHVFRFNNAVKKAREMVHSGELGKVYLCKLTWTNLEKIFPDRDILFDLAPHAFDIVNFIFSKNPQLVYAIGKEFRKQEGEEAAFVNAVLDGILVNLEVSWITPEKKRTITIVGEKKTLFIDALAQSIEEYDIQSGQRNRMEIQPSNALVEELKHFVECIERGKSSDASGKIGAEVVYIIEKSIQSMREGKVLKV